MNARRNGRPKPCLVTELLAIRAVAVTLVGASQLLAIRTVAVTLVSVSHGSIVVK